MGIVRRTLIIGLGKSGKTIARQLKETLQRRYHCLPYVSFFVVDIAEKTTGDNSFSHSEEIALTTPGIAEFVQQNPTIQAKLPRGLTIDFGSNNPSDLINTRIGANLLFLREAPRFQKTLEAAIRRLFDPTEWTEALQQGFEAEQSKDVTIYVVSSLAEPYGGGVVVDAAYLIQAINSFVSDYTYSTAGILLLFGEAPSSTKASVYASLKEIDHLMAHKHYENRHTKVISDKRPFTRSCHLVELTNEAHFDLSSPANGRGMVCEWLHDMIFNALEAETIDVRLDRLASNIDTFLSDPGQQPVPVYSSFGYSAYTIPLPDITEYFSARFGSELVEQCLLAPVSAQEASNAVDLYWREKEKLDLESVVGLGLDLSRETRVSLSTHEQNAAILLFANPPQTANEPASIEDIPLEDLRRRIIDEIRLQETAYFPAYSKKIQDQANRRLIPDVRVTLETAVWSMVESQPVGGIDLAHQFLKDLATRLHNARTTLAGDQKQAQATSSKTITANYARASNKGKAALINQPSLLQTFGRFILVMGLALLAILFIGYQIAQELNGDLLGLVRNLIAIVLVPQGFIALGFMGLLCASKYPADFIIGSWNVGKEGDNIPSFSWVAISVLLVAIVSTGITWLFFRSSETLQLPGAFRGMLLSDYEGRIVNGIIAIGIIAVLNYCFWHWLDVHEMRRLANEWRAAHDKVAQHRALVRRTEVGEEFYAAAETSAQELVVKIESFKRKLELLPQDFQTQSQKLAQVYQQIPTYIRYAVDLDQAKAIFHENIVNLKLESTQIFREPRPSLLRWRDLEDTSIRETIASYVESRFRDYWFRHGITQLVSSGSQPVRSDLERKVGWIAEENAKPFWTYYGAMHGTLKAFVGVGHRDEETVLLSTFSGLAGAIGADPTFLDTGNKHSIICTTFRYDLPAYRLKTVEQCKGEYLTAAQSSAIQTLHVLSDPPADLPDLFPTESMSDKGA